MIFLKIGGSAITDKTKESSAREDVIHRIAQEIASARGEVNDLELLLGHGSGSFGHYTATKTGYGKPGNWKAYAETAASAARLNRLFTDMMLEAGIPAVTMQPSASALCSDGVLIGLWSDTIQMALSHGLVPIVYGDVAFDQVREMAIISTESIFANLAPILKPTRIIIAGIVEGVFAADPHLYPGAELIREVTPASFPLIESQLRGSHGVDVTGGMLTKVKTMVELVRRLPHIRVQLISALRPGLVGVVLRNPDKDIGTVIHSD